MGSGALLVELVVLVEEVVGSAAPRSHHQGIAATRALGGFLLSKFVKLQVCMLPKCHNLSTDFRTIFCFPSRTFSCGYFFDSNGKKAKIWPKSIKWPKITFPGQTWAPGGVLGCIRSIKVVLEF